MKVQITIPDEILDQAEEYIMCNADTDAQKDYVRQVCKNARKAKKTHNLDYNRLLDAGIDEQGLTQLCLAFAVLAFSDIGIVKLDGMTPKENDADGEKSS